MGCVASPDRGVKVYVLMGFSGGDTLRLLYMTDDVLRYIMSFGCFMPARPLSAFEVRLFE